MEVVHGNLHRHARADRAAERHLIGGAPIVEDAEVQPDKKRTPADPAADVAVESPAHTANVVAEASPRNADRAP
ncbi:hypothetical protein GGP96_002659 [Salinibacter ruber]|uniref:Uncharacterized protein n=1 Tax=Salinibacter ruber TaxID=146919 RepID=A0A9X2U3X4_9BACT|nr:hypothetical protein [Salinibacter ruber]MCS3859501.1 hypothetical protein [Salinibacter ruber]MCS3866419.1 hypothetical protein [Salinibacter ruber]MCS4177919.1 hypothetical protein [Salinibacter ruber]